MSRRRNIPPLRTSELIIRQLDDEMLLYDRLHHTALCLNSTAAFIFQQIDGTRTADDIAALLSRETRTTITGDVVLLAVNEFNRFRLLKTTEVEQSRRDIANAQRTPKPTPSLTRRQVIARLGIGAAAVTLPVVTSIVAPTPTQASTCRPNGSSCSSNAQCCSGFCSIMGTCQQGVE